MLDLDELERIGKEVSHGGKWEVDPDWRREGADQVVAFNTETGRTLTVCFMSTSKKLSEGDSAFIVAARNNWDEMIAELRMGRLARDSLAQLHSENERLRKALASANDEAADRLLGDIREMMKPLPNPPGGAT